MNFERVYLVVGLGNPGTQYEKSPHNLGREAVEHFRSTHDFPEFEFSKYWNALVSRGEIDGNKVVLVLPETFMNRSGDAVIGAIEELGISHDDLIVIHDDIDCMHGKVKVSYGKSSGGHRGVDSIISSLKTNLFTRVRVGISDLKESDHSQNLLRPLNVDEISQLIVLASDALQMILVEGREKSMNTFN